MVNRTVMHCMLGFIGMHLNFFPKIERQHEIVYSKKLSDAVSRRAERVCHSYTHRVCINKSVRSAITRNSYHCSANYDCTYSRGTSCSSKNRCSSSTANHV